MKTVLKYFFILAMLTAATMVHAESYQISVSQFVEHPALDAVLKGFQEYLSENGIAADYSVHNAQANVATAGQIAHQIMGEEPDLILGIATVTSQAIAQTLKKAPHMKETPFVFTAVTDPVAAGLVANLEKPGGNITGVSDLLPMDKHIGMVRRFYPNLKRLGVIYNAGEANSKTSVAQIRDEGKRHGFEVIEATAAKSSDVYQAAQSLLGRVDAVFVPTDNTVVSALESAVKVAIQHKMPLFCADVDSVARGAVAAMGFDYYKHGYQTGALVQRIIAGTKPGDLPVETQKALQLHINKKSADRMGVTVPESLLAEADKVYE